MTNPFPGFHIIILLNLLFTNNVYAFQKTDSLYIDNVDTSIMFPGSKPTLISRQFNFTEGPARDIYGNVFFTDQPNNKIWKYDTSGNLSLFMDKAGRSNGLYFDSKGNLLACADMDNQLWAIDSHGKIKILAGSYKGRHLNGPNDVWVHPGGNIYFTDPLYPRNYWKNKKPHRSPEYVYLLHQGNKTPIPVIKSLGKPNGIVGSADGQSLFVSDIKEDKIYKYHIESNGTLTGVQLFTNAVADGMTIDEKGNIYLAGNGVTVFNNGGNKIAHITLPEEWTGNVTFGGKKNDILFITASKGIYILQMKVKGMK
jgi:gluconolactonase